MRSNISLPTLLETKSRFILSFPSIRISVYNVKEAFVVVVAPSILVKMHSYALALFLNHFGPNLVFQLLILLLTLPELPHGIACWCSNIKAE